jgi:SIR2-like domain
MPDEILPLDAFVRAIGATRLTPHALFLGAGASITSGMPSAQMCIWEWKRSIFLTNNIGLESQFTELTLASVQSRIQRWLDRQGLYPEAGAANEYGVYIESCYPIPESRRAYFQEKVRLAKPHIGYHVIGALAAQRLVRSVWTTNFDQLVSRAIADHKVTPVEVGIDCTHRVVRSANSGELLIVSLHGDYRYDALKNTESELQHQEHELEQALIHEVTGIPVIVCGYSGRDASVMRAFSQAFERKGPGTLYWCVQDQNNVASAVSALVHHARANGRTAYIVPTQGFDDLMGRLALHCLDSAGQEHVTQLIAQNAGGTAASRTPFKVDGDHPSAVLKSNAFEVECPSEAIAFELKTWPTTAVWKWVRTQTAGKNIVAVPFKGQILALGAVDDIRSCFGDNIKDRPQRTPLFGEGLRHEDGAITSLLREALLKSMVNGTALHTDGSRELWAPDTTRMEQFQGSSYNVCDSVHVSLRQIDNRAYLILKPSVKVFTRGGELAPRETANAIKLRILGYQHNKEFNDAVNFWRQSLLATDAAQRVYEYPPACASAFRFLIRKAPVFAKIFGNRGTPTISVQPHLQVFLKQRGIEIGEPDLLFSNRSGNGLVRDAHPVRGILSNRPFDFPLTRQQLSPEIRIGIVCPKAETKQLQAYLQSAARSISPTKYESDYLPAFPGFSKAFGVDLLVAEPGSNGWAVCPEPTGANERAHSLDVARSINRCIDVLQASYSPHVVLVFFPDRWTKLRGFISEAERFDVHDFVKASSVQRGIGTQFLEQSTLTDTLQCRVWWWLSLAFYVKAMRTPWVLDGLDRDSAFVGLGMSVDTTRQRGKHVVMGCSHIYSSRGEGLQYRLSQVENPVFFGRNPFLSRDDARRIGEQIRELFFESRSTLPRRVVIHKRTRFTRDEQIGLREGLSGVQEIEMLEVVIDGTLRYIASSADAKGNLHEDNYPVRRGSVVRLDDFTALLWVHGVTSAISGGRRYYQGKRRIPAPLVLRRHCGQSDLRVLAEEILGLSKMNWNTFDLYTKLPATVQSSNEIAQIGSLLQAFHPKAYDYRLFI